MSIAAVLLAAGGGSRFQADEHKLRHPFRGRPLVAWALEAVAAADLDELIVVTGAVDIRDLVPDDALVVRNRDWAAGIGASLHAGWVAAEQRGHDAVVIGLGDQPLVTADAWRAVAAADHAPIVTATFLGKRRPPVRLAQSVWPLLPTTGDDGARALMRVRPDLVGEIACAGEPADIDTTEDADRWS